MGAAQSTANGECVNAEELFRQHAPFVARFLFRLGVRPDGIEDAVQDVFLVAHRQGGYRPGAAKPTSYLANLAMHAAAAYRRRERARIAREIDAAVEDVPSARSNPVEVLETNESLRRLQEALDRLEPDLRTALVLVELEGETCASIAAAMGTPVGTVYWRVHQARKKFQRILQTMEDPARRGLAVQAAGFAGGPRPEGKERAGMVLLMTSPSWTPSDVRDLLRLGAARPPVGYAVQEGLARHLQRVGSGAPAPSWAKGLGAGAKGVAWIATATAAATVATVVVLVVRGTLAPPSRPSQVMTAERASTPPAGPRSTSEWRPLAAGNSPGDAPSVPVELLPYAAPAASVATARGAGSGDPPRADAPPDPQRASSAPPGDDASLEFQQVAAAERLLATDSARALALVRATEARFPDGYVKEEREYVEIMALVATGRLDEARAKIPRFLRAYPESAFSRRVREASRRALLDP
jgi:RNA polymerase sigma-70 factor, ECF subfamily